MEDNNINFDKAVVTPLEARVDVELELDIDLFAYLEELAKKTKMSVDDVVCHILSDVISEQIEIADVNADSLRAATANCRRILLMDNEKPVARVEFLEKLTQKSL